MAQPAPRRFSRLRRIFRWFRICIWLVILAAIVAEIYLDTIGLPNFLKQPLVAKMRAEGVQVDFSRMRLRWYRGIVMDNATFTFLKNPAQPKFFSKEAALYPDMEALRDMRLKFNSLAVKQGALVWPLGKTNSAALTFSNINSEVAFHPNDEIDFTRLTADFANTKITITGSITNAPAARKWKFFQRQKPKEPKKGLNKFADILEKIHLAGSPEINLQFTGDAAVPESFRGKLSFVAPEAETPWGKGTNLQFSADLRDFSAGNNVVRLKADSAETPWGSASNWNSVAKLSFDSTNWLSFQTDLKFSAKKLKLMSGSADSVKLAARAPLSFTNLFPTNLTGKINLAGAKSKWVKAVSAEIAFSAATNSATKVADKSWAAWRKAEPFIVHWQGQFSKIKSPQLQLETFSCAGTWLAPELQITNLDAQLYDGQLAATAQLNVATREVRAKVSSDFDVQKIVALLSPAGQRALADFAWEKPPGLDGELRATLPAWTNRSTNWQKEILPTLELNGHASVEHISYRDVPMTSATTDFAYSHRVWTLPHFRVNRPEGSVDLNLMANDQTQEFSGRIHSQVDPKAIRHLLAKKEQTVLDDFQFTSPPEVRGELRGNWNEMENISLVNGEISAKHFSFRSNSVDKLNCAVQFTNQNLRVSELRLDQGEKFVSAKQVALDFATMKVYFTDVYSTVNPYPIIRLLGRQVVANMAPYQFAVAPAVRLNGSLLVTNVDDADLHFLVEGNQFRWKNLFADKISGQVDWVGLTLAVTNIHAVAYQNGTIEGAAFFDFSPPKGTDFHFDFAAADLNLQSFISGLSGKTNQLEGLLYGQLAFDSANTHDSKSWRGHGRANLRDGLLWDVPLFGIFSPVLNTLMPGAGNSRAREGSATFVIRDGIIYTDDLEIRSSGLRLQYRGGVDFDRRVDARVEAAMLRDAWVIGPIVSMALTPISKMFEYKVSGTVDNPKSEPVYIPNFLMMTLRPFHSIKEALMPEKKAFELSPNPPAEQNP